MSSPCLLRSTTGNPASASQGKKPMFSLSSMAVEPVRKDEDHCMSILRYILKQGKIVCLVPAGVCLSSHSFSCRFQEEKSNVFAPSTSVSHYGL